MLCRSFYFSEVIGFFGYFSVLMFVIMFFFVGSEFGFEGVGFVVGMMVGMFILVLMLFVIIL